VGDEEGLPGDGARSGLDGVAWLHIEFVWVCGGGIEVDNAECTAIEEVVLELMPVRIALIVGIGLGWSTRELEGCGATELGDTGVGR